MDASTSVCSRCLCPRAQPPYSTCARCRGTSKKARKNQTALRPDIQGAPGFAVHNPPILAPRPVPALDPILLSSSPRRNPSPSANRRIRPRAKKRRTEDTRASEAVERAVGLLEYEFRLRETASEEFPPGIAASHIRSSIGRYEDEMSAASERSICCSCGIFVPTGDIYNMDDRHGFIQLQEGRLDECGHHESSWDLCRFCYTDIRKWKIPKFSAANSINVTMCQQYPSALEDLTAVEECLIAKCHPIGTILKLRPGGHSTPTNYNALRGHMIVIPQDPGPLLQILPSPELKLDNLIKVFWLGKHPPANEDLKQRMNFQCQLLTANITNREPVDEWRGR
jgi:hypothetical protein